MSIINWKYEKRKLNELIENKDNPRRISKKRAQELKQSLEGFGVCQPIVCQPDGRVIGGHQRIRTLHAIGYDEVDVAIPSRVLSEKEEKKLTIILNKVSGDFDLDMLANRWDVDVLIESGFTEEELHVDIIPNQKPKKLSINIKFENEDDLNFFENHLNPMICDFPTAKMKVRRE